jgi:hypothetical protein
MGHTTPLANSRTAQRQRNGSIAKTRRMEFGRRVPGRADSQERSDVSLIRGPIEIVVLGITAPQLIGDIHRYVSGPAFGGVEGDYTNRTFVLTVEQVSDQRCPPGSRFVGFTPGPSEMAKIDQNNELTGFTHVNRFTFRCG